MSIEPGVNKYVGDRTPPVLLLLSKTAETGSCILIPVPISRASMPVSPPLSRERHYVTEYRPLAGALLSASTDAIVASLSSLVISCKAELTATSVSPSMRM